MPKRTLLPQFHVQISTIINQYGHQPGHFHATRRRPCFHLQPLTSLLLCYLNTVLCCFVCCGIAHVVCVCLVFLHDIQIRDLCVNIFLCCVCVIDLFHSPTAMVLCVLFACVCVCVSSCFHIFVQHTTHTHSLCVITHTHTHLNALRSRMLKFRFLPISFPGDIFCVCVCVCV